VPRHGRPEERGSHPEEVREADRNEPAQRPEPTGLGNGRVRQLVLL
jgi:hypothetical protein